MTKPPQTLVDAAKELSSRLSKLSFDDPVTHVYNPLEYAIDPHTAYLQRARPQTCEIIFLGMNPGPWGMAQTGVPFGEIAAVRDFLGIEAAVDRPPVEHPKRPVEGFDCQKSEVSGRRLWGCMRDRFKTAAAFFQKHFVANYCPLVFMEQSGKNFTPDKLPAEVRGQLDAACDWHLAQTIRLLEPKHLVGIGVYAEKCFRRVLTRDDVDTAATVSRVLHPSPASPAANKDWAGKATQALIDAGVWS